MPKLLVAATIAALFLLAAGPASAARFQIGEGKVPAVAVDPGNNAYIAWNGNEIPASLNFCHVPRGATACDRRLTLPTQGDSLTRPVVQTDGEVVHVLSYRYGLSGPRFDGVFLFTSTDGGVTFGPGVMVGDVPIYDAVSGPGTGISLVTSAVTQGEFFQRVPTDGSSVVGQRALLSVDHPYLGTVALTNSAQPIVVFDDGFSNAQWRVYAGSGDINDAAKWTPAQDLGYADYPHLAGGPNGVLLLAADQSRQLHVRRYLGQTGFGAARPIPGAQNGESAQDYMTQDPGGRLHVLLPQITANGSRLFYGTSDDGVTWARRSFAFEPLAQQVRAAATEEHDGFAVWQTASSPPAIQVLELDAGVELGRTVSVRVVRGTVRIGQTAATIRGGRVGGGGTFRTRIEYRRLRGEETIPVGSFLDTKRGTVELVTATARIGRTQSGQFSSGLFEVRQSRKRSAKGLTELRLKGGKFGKCGARGGRASAAQLSRRTVRRLRANAKGRFRTRGRGSAATVRGTVWTTTDRCDGTLTAVKRGRVAVRDFRRKRTVVVRAGKSYLARVR
jgi:hypothetical protein